MLMGVVKIHVGLSLLPATQRSAFHGSTRGAVLCGRTPVANICVHHDYHCSHPGTERLKTCTSALVGQEKQAVDC